MNENLDDYDFTPSANSNLASLFDSSSVNAESSSLIYTAPKQPKSAVQTDLKNEPAKTESSVICARVVHVWKLIDNKYVAIGKLGLAIIGSSAQNSYEIILYREKRNVILRIKICNDFEISLKKDNFISFYNNLKENWLIKFNSSEDCITIIKQIENFGGKVVTIRDKNESIHLVEKEDGFKTADDSSSNSDNPENRAKADILSRIAKMGQSILPNKNLDTDTSSAEDEIPKTVDNVLPSDNRVIEAQDIIPAPSTIQIPRHVQTIPNTFVVGQPMTYDPLNIYLSENRAHNSEVRINLSHISEKLNHILKVVDVEKPIHDFNSDALKSKVKVLNLRIENLSRELATYKQENAKLKQQVNQQEDTLRGIEQNKTKEQEIVKIEFETKIKTYDETIREFSETIEKQKIQIEELKKDLESSQDVSRHSHEMSEMNSTIIELKEKLKEFEKEHQKHENAVSFSDQESKENSAHFIMILKESMNEMYGNIISKFSEDKQYQSSQVNTIIAQNIKSTTLNIIQNFQNIYRNECEPN